MGHATGEEECFPSRLVFRAENDALIVLRRGEPCSPSTEYWMPPTNRTASTAPLSQGRARYHHRASGPTNGAIRIIANAKGMTVTAIQRNTSNERRMPISRPSDVACSRRGRGSVAGVFAWNRGTSDPVGGGIKPETAGHGQPIDLCSGAPSL